MTGKRQKGPPIVVKKPPTPHAGMKRPEPTPGWDYGLSEQKRRFLLHYLDTGKKTESARVSGIEDSKASQRAHQWWKSVSIENAWALLNGMDPPHPHRLPKTPKSSKPAIKAEDVARSAPADYKTLAGKRLLMESRRTPLDVMVDTMNSLYDRAIDEMVKGDLGKPEDTEESIALKRAACQMAKDAAPYMHARLSSVEQRNAGDDLKDLSAEGLRKELEDAQKAIDAMSASRLRGAIDKSAGPLDDAPDELDTDIGGDDLPPMH